MRRLGRSRATQRACAWRMHPVLYLLYVEKASEEKARGCVTCVDVDGDVEATGVEGEEEGKCGPTRTAQFGPRT